MHHIDQLVVLRKIQDNDGAGVAAVRSVRKRAGADEDEGDDSDEPAEKKPSKGAKKPKGAEPAGDKEKCKNQ